MLGTLFESEIDREQEAARRIEAHAQSVVKDFGYRGTKLTHPQRQVLLQVVQRRGRDHAISIAKLAEWVRISPREVKAIVRDLRLVFGVSIGSTRDAEGGGYYLIRTKQEALDTARPFTNQAKAEIEIVKAICSPFGLAEFEGQMRMEGVE